MKKIQLSLLAISLMSFEVQSHLLSAQEKTNKHADYADYADYGDYSDYSAQQQEDSFENGNGMPGLFDMESLLNDFILETKKIDFPEYPGAFNPSLIRWQGSLLMSFRVYNPANGSTNPFALVWLDDNLEPVSAPQIFELPFHNPVLYSKQQDPRLIAVGERLFVAYNNILENVTHRELRRMFVAELFYDGKKFTASSPACFVDFEGKSDMRYEKNWVPFEYRGELLFGSSFIPHRIFRPVFGKGACETVAATSGKIQWDWGMPRGGTQAILDGDHYLAFFHSWKNLSTVQSNGKNIAHYVMGAYTFQAHLPFAITAISPEPIVARSFYRPPFYKTWKPMRCIFPAGLVVDDNDLLLSYGKQDHEIWIAKLDKKKLLESLTPITSE